LLDWYIPLLIFILVASFTPGPNNLIAMSIGFNFGFKRVTPHIFGVSIGFGIMLLIIALLIKDLMQKYEAIFTILKYISSLYLLYLAYKIATAPIKIDNSSNQKPITFVESMIFQWINPKAWAGALATITLYLPKDNYNFALGVTILTFSIAIIFAISLWGYLGDKIKSILSNPLHIRVFNIVMAILLVFSVLLILF